MKILILRFFVWIAEKLSKGSLFLLKKAHDIIEYVKLQI
jgi:hypothetical protein